MLFVIGSCRDWQYRLNVNGKTVVIYKVVFAVYDLFVAAEIPVRIVRYCRLFVQVSVKVQKFCCLYKFGQKLSGAEVRRDEKDSRRVLQIHVRHYVGEYLGYLGIPQEDVQGCNR